MDSEEEALDDLEFDGSSDDDEIDEDILDAIEGDLAAEEASEAAAEVGERSYGYHDRGQSSIGMNLGVGNRRH